MRSVPYSEVLKGVADAMGWKTDDDGTLLLDDREWHMAKRAITKAYGKVHPAAFWRELTQVEKRHFADAWESTTAYVAGDFVWFDQAAAYYQAIQAHTGQEPATIDADGVVTVNLSYWAEAVRSLDRTYWDVTVDYEQGDRVYYVDDGLHYQAHTASPAGTLPTNTLYWGEISELDAYVPFKQTGFFTIDQVAGVFACDPRENRNEPHVPYAESSLGVQVLDPCVLEPWIEYLPRPWKFKGDIWDATVVYTSDEEDGYGIPSVPPGTGSVNQEFATVADMLASDTSLWSTAWCQNFETVGDSIVTQWFKTTEAGLTVTGTDILESADGAILRRTLIIYPQE